MSNVRLMTKALISGVIVCVGMVTIQAYEEHRKTKHEIELLRTQKETSLKERERYEKQIELITEMLENEMENYIEKLAEATWNKISDLFVPLKEDSTDDSEITKKDYDELQEFCKKLQWECATLRNRNKELKKQNEKIVNKNL